MRRDGGWGRGTDLVVGEGLAGHGGGGWGDGVEGMEWSRVDGVLRWRELDWCCWYEVLQLGVGQIKLPAIRSKRVSAADLHGLPASCAVAQNGTQGHIT